jgi:hypothetical protein
MVAGGGGLKPDNCVEHVVGSCGWEEADSVGRTVFVGHCRAQSDGVWNRVVPCLHTGRAEVPIDRQRRVAGRAGIGQIEATHEVAEPSLVVRNNCISKRSVGRLADAIDELWAK